MHTIATQDSRTTIAQRRANERILRATVTADSVILTPEEREFFDAPEHRDTRSLMSSNRAPFLS